MQRVGRSDQLQLGRVHRGMVGGAIAKPAIKQKAPDQPQRAERDERSAPVHEAECEYHQRRRECPAPACERPHDPLRAGALRRRDPQAERFGEIRKAPGLARAEQESSHPQRSEVPCEAGQRGERGPRENNADQHCARSDPVAHPAARNFEQRVRERECSEDQSHLRFAQAQIARDGRRGLRDRYAIDVGQHGERDREDNYPVARPRGTCFH